MLIGSASSTSGAREAESKINEHGSGIGPTATAGRKFIGITWSATILMLISLGAWILVWRRNKNKVENLSLHDQEGQNEEMARDYRTYDPFGNKEGFMETPGMRFRSRERSPASMIQCQLVSI